MTINLLPHLAREKRSISIEGFVDGDVAVHETLIRIT